MQKPRSRPDALPARTVGRLIGVVGNAIRPIPVGAPADMRASIGRARDGTTDDRTRREGCCRIPPAVAVAAIARSRIAITMITAPVARAGAGAIMAIMAIIRAVVWAMAVAILHLGYAIGLAGRLQELRLRHGLYRPGGGRIDG